MIANLVAIIVSFGLHVAMRVCSDLLKFIYEKEGVERGNPINLATGTVNGKIVAAEEKEKVEESSRRKEEEKRRRKGEGKRRKGREKRGGERRKNSNNNLT